MLLGSGGLPLPGVKRGRQLVGSLMVKEPLVICYGEAVLGKLMGMTLWKSLHDLGQAET